VSTARQRQGAQAETLALARLEAAGLALVARNWSCPAGELDLVMRDGDTLVVVEVRSRADADHGRPEETIGAAKRRRIARATQWFVQDHPALDLPVRFDVVAVLDGPAGPELDWLRAAFDAD
jgi:putative endonuclease